MLVIKQSNALPTLGGLSSQRLHDHTAHASHAHHYWKIPLDHQVSWLALGAAPHLISRCYYPAELSLFGRRRFPRLLQAVLVSVGHLLEYIAQRAVFHIVLTLQGRVITCTWSVHFTVWHVGITTLCLLQCVLNCTRDSQSRTYRNSDFESTRFSRTGSHGIDFHGDRLV